MKPQKVIQIQQNGNKLYPVTYPQLVKGLLKQDGQINPLMLPMQQISRQVQQVLDKQRLKALVVQQLPTEGIDTHTIYLVLDTVDGDNVYNEWMHINGKWQKLGFTKSDFTDYATKVQLQVVQQGIAQEFIAVDQQLQELTQDTTKKFTATAQDITQLQSEVKDKASKQEVTDQVTQLQQQIDTAVRAVTEMPQEGTQGQVLLYTGTTDEYSKGHFYQWDNEWKDLTDGFKVGTVSDITCIKMGNTVKLRWKDPDDVVVSGSTIVAWGKTVVVKKTTGFPQSPQDGVVVVSSTVRNQYSTDSLQDTLGNDQSVAYYRWFCYTQDGLLTADPDSVKQTNDFTWTDILAICKDPSVDARQFFSPGDVLGAANSVRPTDGNGNYQWQVVNVTPSQITLMGYKLAMELQFDKSPQKTYALTADIVFRPQQYLKVGNNKYFLKDTQAVDVHRKWLPSNGASNLLMWYQGRWVVYDTQNAKIQYEQTTKANVPWEGTWSNNVTVTRAKKYFVKKEDGIYEQVNVVAGDAVPQNTYYEANPNSVYQAHGSNVYITRDGKQCAISQFLNTDKDKGTYYQPPTIWSVAPDWTSAQDGFMKGFDTQFLAAVKQTTFVVNRNKVEQGGLRATMTRKFFLPSRDQVGLGSELAEPQGSVFQFYAKATNEDRKKVNLNKQIRDWWLRSPGTGYANSVRFVYTSGALGNYNAYNTYGVSPACIIG